MKAHIKSDFKNLLEYHDWVREKFENLSSLNKHHKYDFSKYEIRSKISYMGSSWFGRGVTYEELEAGVKQFKKPELIDKVFNKISERIAPGLRQVIKARKLQYNAMGIGVFVFDRAAMGMYQLDEFYSPVHKRRVQSEEVEKIKSGYRLIQDGTKVIQRKEQRPDGKPKIRTSSKKVFAYLPPQRKMADAVELFISCGAWGGQTAEDMLYSGITAIVIAELLELARVKTKISILIGTSPDGVNYFGSMVPVKNFDEPLDKNVLALLSSDPRFYRYDGFRGILCTYDHFKRRMPSSYGSGADAATLEKIFETSGYAEENNITPNRFYFGRTFSEYAAVEHINKTIRLIADRINPKVNLR